jgi:hypothetical protein
MLMNPINHGGGLYAAVSRLRNWNWDQNAGQVKRIENRVQPQAARNTNPLETRDQMNTHYWMGKNINLLV